MTKKGTFGLALIAMIAAMVAGPARTQAPAPEYSYPPLSAEAHKYYDQHPDEFQQLLKRLPPVSHEIVPGTLLPAGAVPAGGSWTSLNHPLGQNLSNPILLTDGTVIAHVSCTSNWYKFTPDNTGSYNNGTWAAIASLPSGYAPRFFGSGVLPDGRVIIEGGEYNGTGCGGRTKLGAIYDPVANSWTAVDPPAGWGTISDAAGIVLASGIYMQTSCCDNPPHAALLNPSNLTWTNTGSGKFDPYDEESMALLPDGTVLTVDAYTQTGTCGTGSERYNPTTGSWSSAGATIIQQADCAPNRSFEVGPLVMRPNGTAVSFSGVTTANGSAVVIEACPDRSPFQASAVAAQNLLVGGGQPISGYTWTVTSGSTLPNGIVLDNLTGVIHGNGNPPNVPPAGSVLDIPITVTDNQGSTIHTAPGTFVLEVQNPGDGNPCGLPTFQVLAGPIPLTATPGAPYAVTLSVVGGTPPYTWQLATGSFLPAGLILDQSTGVVRGTPSQSTAGQTFNFSVRVTDNTGGPALVQNAYSLTVCNSGTVPCQGLALQFPGSSGLPGTAIYHTSTNTWSAGPVIPSVNGVPYTLADAPAAVLPNGNILFAASPSNWPAKDTFPKPTHFFEMNIADDSITQVALTKIHFSVR